MFAGDRKDKVLLLSKIKIIFDLLLSRYEKKELKVFVCGETLCLGDFCVAAFW